MTKEDIRKEYKLKRRQISAAEKEMLEDLMLIQFQKLELPTKGLIMSYLPIEIQKEYDPWLVEEYHMLMHPDMEMVYPIVNTQEETMRAVIVFDENEYEENAYGVLEPIGGIKVEPKHIDLMIVPLIAFDTKGNRVGYGKGYYDKFLANCSPTLVKIGFSFFDPVEIDDVNATDEKLDYCITPNKTYKFK